jgi:hypothetical protein
VGRGNEATLCCHKYSPNTSTKPRPVGARKTTETAPRQKFDREQFGGLPKSLSVQPEAVCGFRDANFYTNVKTLHHTILGDLADSFANRIVPATNHNVQPILRLFPTLWIKHDANLAHAESLSTT